MKKFGITLMLMMTVLFTVNTYAQISLDEPADKQAILSSLTSMPMVFTENQGQWGDKTLFKAEARGVTFYFCKDEVAYLFMRNTDVLIEGGMAQLECGEGGGLSHDFQNEQSRYKKEAILIHAKFIGANPNPQIIAEDKLSHNFNYFYGSDPAKWCTNVPNYSSIVYKDIWQGIDLRYQGNDRRMKYDFIVNPGADISQIRVRYEGAEGLSVAPNGDLQTQTKFGPVSENIPLVYQESDGDKFELTGRYVLKENNEFGFEVEEYNRSQTLVIDPELLYSTYLGGNSQDNGSGITVDASGNAYVIGSTYSTDFPIANPYDSSFNGGYYDVFVTKFSQTGDSLIYSTFIGGSTNDAGIGIFVDNLGNAYITGSTGSSNFPMVNAYDSSYNGGDYDGYVLKLSPDGDSLIYSTYLGGSFLDEGVDIVIDGSGNAYVNGWTTSPNFPTFNAYDNSRGGEYDVFVSKISPTGDSLIFSTYFGGNQYEGAGDIAMDGSENFYLTGTTFSSDFPTVEAFDSTLAGENDIFVSKFTSEGDSLIYSTYLGGNNTEYGLGIAVNDSGNAYLTGWTNSSDFPTFNAYDSSYNEGSDAFVTKFSTTGDSLIYSTYFGGNEEESGRDIGINELGNIYIAGRTESTNLPLVDPYDDVLGGDWDGYVSKFSSDGNTLIYSTYFGGNNNEEVWGIAVDGSGNAYVTGYTRSTDYPTVNPYDDTLDDWNDAFVSKFGPGVCLLCDAESFSPVVPNVDGTIIWRMDVTNCGESATDVYVEIYPTVGDCASGTQYDFNLSRLAVSNLSYGDSTSIYYWYRPGTVTGVTEAAINIDVGAAIDDYIGNCCFEFIFAYGFGRPGSEVSFGPGEWGERDGETILPITTVLNQNYPNPFNATTNISFDLSQAGDVNLSVYNLAGQKVETLVDSKMTTGHHSITWDASTYSSGVYFYKLTAGENVFTKRMTLLK
ncbi:MAG: T9SS type A sorting domain-containing protein [candidate division Zixibacteria bacterium]|nr:T9SS type A sorting domain-containing protein [candidate division Zixibacteria bacterium]